MLKAWQWLVLGIAVASCSASGARAQEQKSFNAALASGFEIKSVTLVPADAVKRVDSNANTDAVAITLQNKNAVAVCFIGLSNWLNLTKASLDNTALCEVH